MLTCRDARIRPLINGATRGPFAARSPPASGRSRNGAATASTRTCICFGPWNDGCRNGTPRRERGTTITVGITESARTGPLTAPHTLRVLWVTPKPEFEAANIFVRRQNDSLLAAGVDGRRFHVRDRTSPWHMLRSIFQLRADNPRVPTGHHPCPVRHRHRVSDDFRSASAFVRDLPRKRPEPQ